ncbi:hypothetical protein V6N11_002066 [Hibiscus sabdariffa]|uniref:Uncharacterized protein n=1 Tax=Hibiscus sabdariffa TaxID=183260 RepID=A0ABR2QU89_9ROSI
MMFIDHGCKWLLGKKVNQLRGLKDTTNEGNNGLNGFNGSRFGVLAEGEIDVIIVSQAEDPKRLGKDEERKCLAKRKAMDKEEIKVSTQGDLHVKFDDVSRVTDRANYVGVEDYQIRRLLMLLMSRLCMLPYH